MKWKEDEVEFLRENYVKKIPLEEIANKLNRSLKSIKRKAQNIKLHREWVRFNKRPLLITRDVINRNYYEKNKEKVYKRKMDRRKKMKEEAVIIAGGKCKNCGYNKCISALEFHHHETNKEGNVSTLIKNESRHKLLKEASKCILLCANCHRELHSKGGRVS